MNAVDNMWARKDRANMGIYLQSADIYCPWDQLQNTRPLYLRVSVCFEERRI